MYRAKYLVKRDVHETKSRKRNGTEPEEHEITLVIDHPQPEPARAAHSSNYHCDDDPANTPAGVKHVRFSRQPVVPAPSRPLETGGGGEGGGGTPSWLQQKTAAYQQHLDASLCTAAERTCSTDSEAAKKARVGSHWLSAARSMRPSTAQHRRHTACNRMFVSLGVVTIVLSVFGLHPFETVHLKDEHGDMGSHPGWGTLGIDFQKGLQGPGGKSLHVVAVHPSLAFQDIKKTEGLGGMGRQGPGDELEEFERHEKALALAKEDTNLLHRADGRESVGQVSLVKGEGGRESLPG